MGFYIEGTVTGELDLTNCEFEFDQSEDLLEFLNDFEVCEILSEEDTENISSWDEVVGLYKSGNLNLKAALEEFLSEDANLLNYLDIGEIDPCSCELESFSITIQNDKVRFFGGLKIDEGFGFTVDDFLAKITVWQRDLDYHVKHDNVDLETDIGDLKINWNKRYIDIKNACFDGETETGEPYREEY